MDDYKLMGTYFVVSLLVGLAFGILVKVFAGAEVERWRMNKVADDSDMAGADEGDIRTYREIGKERM
jgi:hypothetical protein